MSSWFANHGNQIPDNLIPVYQHLASSIISNLAAGRPRQDDDDNDDGDKTPHDAPTVYRVLDVATGTGVLFPFLLQAANNMNLSLNITAVDLSPNMINLARTHADEVLQNYSKCGGGQQQQHNHAIDLVQANVLDYPMPPVAASLGKEEEEEEQYCSPSPPLFDAVIVNACYGNFFDPLAVLQHLTTGVASNGSIFVTHPLGSAFVQQLHDSDPSTVPHLLPSSARHWQTDFLLKGQVPLTVQECYDSITLQDDEPLPCYFTHLRRVRYTLLPQVMRFPRSSRCGVWPWRQKAGLSNC